MSMLRELEGLLREITQQGREQPQQPRPRPEHRPAPAAPVQEVEAEIVEAEPVREADYGLGGHIGDVYEMSDATVYDSPLDADRADEAMGTGAHSHADHDATGFDDNLAQGRGKAAATPSPDVLSLLRNPGNIWQAVVLSEILRRPSDRW